MTTCLATLPKASLMFVCDIVFCIEQIYGLHRVIGYICICSNTSGISPTPRLPSKSRGWLCWNVLICMIYSKTVLSIFLLLIFLLTFLNLFLVCKVIMFLTVIYTGKVSADVIDFTSVVHEMTPDFKHIFILFYLIQAFLEECPVSLYLYKMFF